MGWLLAALWLSAGGSLTRAFILDIGGTSGFLDYPRSSNGTHAGANGVGVVSLSVSRAYDGTVGQVHRGAGIYPNGSDFVGRSRWSLSSKSAL